MSSARRGLFPVSLYYQSIPIPQYCQLKKKNPEFLTPGHFDVEMFCLSLRQNDPYDRYYTIVTL